MNIEKALSMAWWEARTEAKKHSDQIGKKPLAGWSQAKHDAYHKTHEQKALQACNWLHTRMMQYNPD